MNSRVVEHKQNWTWIVLSASNSMLTIINEFKKIIDDINDDPNSLHILLLLLAITHITDSPSIFNGVKIYE